MDAAEFLKLLVEAVAEGVFWPQRLQKFLGFLKGLLSDMAGTEQLSPTERDLVNRNQALAPPHSTPSMPALERGLTVRSKHYLRAAFRIQEHFERTFQASKVKPIDTP